jgi:hypothetical protein
MKPAPYFKTAVAVLLLISAANNVRAQAPDLVVTNVAVLSPAVSGQSFTLTYSVANQGTGPVSSNVSWSDQIHLCTNTTLASSTTTWTWNWKGFVPVGGGYSTNTTETLPSLQSGTYYLIAVTDTGHTIPGENYANNTNAPVAFTVTAPDLVVTNMTVLSPAVSGQSFMLTYSVANQGTGPVSSNVSWSDQVHLCTNTTLASSTTTWTWNWKGFVPVGGSYNTTNTETLPSLQPGTYYLIAVTDTGHSVPGDNFNNNTSSPVAFTLTAPDLVVTNVTVLGPAESGQPLALSWEVLNQGNGPANGSWQDRLYLCTNTTLNSSITYWYWPESGPMVAGGSYTNDTTAPNGITLPTLSAGTYYWIAVTDFGHTVSGDNFNNNTNAPVPLQVTASDLVVTNVAVLSSVISGHSFTMTYTETNQGNAPASGNWTDKIYLSTNTTVKGVLATWSSNWSGTLPAEGSSNSTNLLVLPVLQTGTDYLYVVTDSGHTIAEGNFNNNTNAPVVVSVIGPPQIVTQPISQTVAVGANVAFSVTTIGVPPLYYEWQKNGTNIVGATNTTLNFSNAQANDTGFYDVIVGNVAGSVTSSVALLEMPVTFSDQFANDSGLNAALWTTTSSLLNHIAAYGEGGCNGNTFVPSALSFGPDGMQMTGANQNYQFTGIQSAAVFSPPFTLNAAVTGTIANGCPFELFLE